MSLSVSAKSWSVLVKCRGTSRNLHMGHLKSLLNSFSYTELNKNPVEGFSAGLIDDNDLYRWEVLIIGPPDTL